MGNITGASLSSIENRLSGVSTYHPMEAETFSDWATEAGDVVTVRRGNESYQSPVYSSKLVWRGAPQVTLSSTGNKERESLQKVSGKKYKKGGNALRNSNNLQRQLTQAYNGLRSFFEITESRLRAEFKSDYDGLSSYFEVTRSRMAADFEGKYDGLTGFFEVTRSHLVAEFSGKYDGLVGHFEVTRSIMQADFSGKYDGLVGHFEVTRSQMAADFSNQYAGLSSHFELTASSFNVAINNVYTGLSSKIESTESSLESSVSSATTRAALLLKINGDGKSQAYLEADRIKIGNSGQTIITLNDRVSINSSGDLNVSGNITTSLLSDEYVQTKKIRLVGASSSQGANIQDLAATDIQNMIVQAEVYNNTLYLWKKGDTLSSRSSASYSFSKAVTLSGSWSGGTLTIGVTPDVATNTYKRSFVIPTETTMTSAKVATVTLYARSYSSGNPPTIIDDDLVGTYLVNVTANYNAGWDYAIANKVTCTGEATKTLSYGESVAVTTKVTNSSGNENYLFAATYTAPTDANITAGNIKSGVTIFGVTGAYTSDANATAGHVLSGKTAYVNGSKITGTIPTSTNSGSTITPGTSQKTAINSGQYASGNIYVAGSSNLTAGNIKSGVTIFGVTGSYAGTHSPVASEFVAQSSDPGSSYTLRQVTPDAETKWYKFTASCGGETSNYRLKVNGSTIKALGFKSYYDDLIAHGNTYWDYQNGKVYIPKGNGSGTVCYVDVTLNGWTLGEGGATGGDWATYWMQGWHYYYDLFVGNVGSYWNNTTGVMYAPSREDSTQSVPILDVTAYGWSKSGGTTHSIGWDNNGYAYNYYYGGQYYKPTSRTLTCGNSSITVSLEQSGSMVYINDANGTHMAGLAVSTSSNPTISATVVGQQSARAGQTAVNDFTSGATRIFSNYTLSKDGTYSQYYKFKIEAGGSSKYYYFVV